MSQEDLVQVLCRLPRVRDKNVIIGLNSLDDAGVYKLSKDIAVIQTVDVFSPVVDDPFLYGQIVAANCLSDIYAMGGEPKIAFNLLWFPGQIGDKIIAEIVKGACSKVREAGANLAGRQVMYDEEIKYGLGVFGVVHPEKIIAKAGTKKNDVLILTKPIGTGVISSAIRKNKAGIKDSHEIARSMVELNKTSAKIMRKYKATACTDITGFGLVGHAYEMAKMSNVSFLINSDSVPVFEKAYDFAVEEFMEGISLSNKNYMKDKIKIDVSVDEKMVNLLFDSQTSGGLIFSVAEKDAEKCLEELKKNKIKSAAIIGKAVSKREKPLLITK